MNSEKPQNQKSNFPEAFDNEEMEIDVTYEEISPEEQLKIRQRIGEVPVDFDDEQSAEIVDIWLDDKPEVTSSQESGTSGKIEQFSTQLQHQDSETELLSDDDDDVTSSFPETETPIKESETELLSDDDDDDVTSSFSETETPIKESETELLSDDDDDVTSSFSETETPIKESETETLSDNLSNSSNKIKSLANETQDDLIDLKELNSLEKESNLLEESVNVEPEQSIGETSIPNTELIADSWLDEPEKFSSSLSEKNKQRQELSSEITALKKQKEALLEEIKTLQLQKETAIAQQSQELAKNLISMIEEGTRELKERKNHLLVDLEKLERRKERIRQEMQTTFAGASQDLAVRIQGFKDYLVGSLQDLATAAEKLELSKIQERQRVSPRETRETRSIREERQPRNPSQQVSSQPQFTEQAFAEQTRRIRQLLEQYRTQPDYYGSPWQLRRTFEPIHAEKVQEWFFGQGGRGAIKGMGSRLQNILVASAIISVLYRLYRDRCRVLVLVDTPEKLGEWRRGLQDCLGVSRNDFGSNRGVVLFESADVLVQRAERLLEDKLLPLIIIDETEELINLSLLKFPLWLAFAEKPQPKSSGYLY